MTGEANYSMSDHQPYHPFLRFYTSAFLLVPQWSTGSIFGLVGAMLAAVVASVTFQCLNEYLQHLRRKSITGPGGQNCCGAEIVTVWQKLGQTILVLLRVVCGYFMMYCVMTRNIWLLIAVVIGAAVGYGVGKPLVANEIRDSIASHGYQTARMEISNHGRNRSERSKSWRYQPIQRPDFSHLRHGDDHAFSDSEINSNSKYSDVGENGAEIVWIRRSSEDLSSKDHHMSEVFDDSENDVQLRHPENYNSIRSTGSTSTRSMSRFRSTSKVINDSFLTNRSETGSNYSSDSRLNSSYRSPSSAERKTRYASRTMSSASSGRFKPVSQLIMKQMSLNEDFH